MALDTLQLLTHGVTVAMVKALGQYAQESHAGTFTDSELHGLLARFGGSMVKAIDYLTSLGAAKRRQGELFSKPLLQ